MIRDKESKRIYDLFYLTLMSLYTLWKGVKSSQQVLVIPKYVLLLHSYLLLLYYFPLCLYLSKEFQCFSTTGCLWPQLAVYYCPWNSFSYLSLDSLNWLLTHLLSFCSSSSSSYLPLCPLTMTLSPSLPATVSILLFHCLFTSLHRPCSITLSPLATSYSVLPLSLILSTGNNSLSPPPPMSCRVHRIHSALSGTMATRKLL